MKAVAPSVHEAIDHHIRALLKKLNSAGGKPLEEHSPKDARQVLVDLQASANVDLPPARVKAVTIEHDGQSIELTVVHPAGEESRRRRRRRDRRPLQRSDPRLGLLNPISQALATRASLIQVAE